MSTPPQRHLRLVDPSDSEAYIGSKPAIAVYRVGGREYPVVTSPKCRTCRSPYRPEIERSLLQGFGYKAVIESLPEGHNLSVDMLRNHVKYHLPLQEATKRVVIEDRAKELGLNIEQHVGSLADHMVLMRLGIKRVVERLADGEIEPDMTDGIALVRAMLQFEELEQGGIDHAAMMQGFLAYMDALQATLDEFAPMAQQEAMVAFSRRLGANPIMRSLLSKSEGAIIDAAVVEDDEPLLLDAETDDRAEAHDGASWKLLYYERLADVVPEMRDSATARVIRAREDGDG